MNYQFGEQSLLLCRTVSNIHKKLKKRITLGDSIHISTMNYQFGEQSLLLCRTVSNIHKKLKKRITLVRRASAFLVSLTAGGVFLYYELLNLHNALGVMSHSKVIEQEKVWKPTYIYLSELDQGFENNEWSSDKVKRKSRDAPHTNRFWFSWLKAKSPNPLRLLELAHSEQHSVRILGVQALASQHHWHDSQYLLVAQACDNRTLIGLAHSANVDPRFFRKPPSLPPTSETQEDELQGLLGSLPVTDIDKCTQYFTSHALVGEKMPSEETVAVWSFDGTGIVTEKAGITYISNLLHALFIHSKVPSHCSLIVQHNGLQMLQRVYEKNSDQMKICRGIGRILSNIALHHEYHRHIISAGWVTVLAKWINSSDLTLSMLASKTLANLDRDFGSGKYRDGIYTYHPTHRYSRPICVDVVFVHGLLGGPFLTWRQKDPDVLNGKLQKHVHENTLPESERDVGTKGKTKEPEWEKPEEQTDCWPKDWLAKDFPNMRLLTVEYDTHLTEWAPKCPFESEKRSLAHRSNAILQKLKDANLGKRPIIWIGHSMGGLLIKNILVLARSDPELKRIVDNTKGIVFYSVPHQGSPLAARSVQSRYLLFPSVEVAELVQDSEMLTNLHKAFTKIMFNARIPLLSFGEGSPTDLPFNLKEVLVPPDSSNPGYGEFHLMSDMNHLDVCKPNSRDSPLYQLTLTFISNCLPQKFIDCTRRENMLEHFGLSDMMH